jgi:uncharacterized OB-fold protein/acyl dehydratase
VTGRPPALPASPGGLAHGPAAEVALHATVPGLAGRLVAAGEQVVGMAREPVSMPLIRQWCDAIGDRNPVYTDAAAAGPVHGGLVAPPAMIQVWTMPGLARKPAEAADELIGVLKAAGYTGVVATNCEQSYDRYLRPGELLRTTTRMGGFSGPKKTSLGEGYFVTWHTTWYSGAERVGQMMFRVLQFKPPGHAGDPPAGPSGRPAGAAESGPPRAVPAGSSPSPDEPRRYPLRPAMNDDTSFFWAGAKAGELRIQRCGDCGSLRHPPGPMCPHCHSGRRDYVVASGRGEVFSFVVHHHPPVPGRAAPFVVAVVGLPEGVRVTGNVLGVPPDQVRVGMPVEVMFEHADDDLVLPQWRPARQAPEHPAAADVLPELAIPLTATTVVTTAIATRDFTPLHHDVQAARAQGSLDIFLNILTTMGLTQRFVTDWAGPRALVRAIDVRLGAPAYAGDTLTMTGRVTGRGAGGEVTVQVRGVCGQGGHVTATVRLGMAEQR